MKSNVWKKLFIIETILVVFASIVLFVYITKPDEGSVEDGSTAVESYYVDSNDLSVDVENSTETDSIESTKTDSDNVDNIQADIDVEEVKDKIIYMPGVTEEMSNPEYWIDIQEEPDKVLITKPQIEALNKKIVETSGCRMYDLESYSEDEAEFGIVVRQTDVKGSPTNSLMNGSDANFDDNQLAGAKVNDPVCIIGHSEDDSFYKVRTRDYEGWIRSEDVALCSNKEEWLKAWKFTEEGNFVVVTTDRIFTEDNRYTPDTSRMVLTMGTVLELVDKNDISYEEDGRAPFNSYMIYIPIRNSDGSYGRTATHLPEHLGVSVGYQPLTERNIINTAFECLGDIYGWGSSLNSEDCSGYIQSIYRTFGIIMPRDTDQQELTPCKRIILSGLENSDRKAMLDETPTGTALYMKGHTVMYLGEVDGNHYCINSSGSVRGALGGKLKTRTIMINSIDQTQMVSTGATWTNTFTSGIVLWEKAE